MGDVITKVTTKSWGSKIGDSIKGVLVGLLLFLASFAVLWMGEGITDLSKIAKNAVEIDPNAVDTANEGTLVSVTGEMASDELLGDPGYLNPGKYLTLNRSVEMYAWIEKRETKSEDKVGGKTETTETISYHMGWTSSPQDSSRFEDPRGHENPSMGIKGSSETVSTGTIGVYPINSMKSISLPGGEELTLNSSDIVYERRSRRSIESNYIYIPSGYGNFNNPEVGDIRIKYTALENPPDRDVTVFGTLKGGEITSFHDGDDTLYHARFGTKEAALSALHGEYKMKLWIFRAIGFFMMWIGLTMFFGPINAVLDVLPFLGDVGRMIIGFVMFIVALVLSIITIIISMIAHNIIALIITLVIIIGGVVAFSMMRRKKKEGAGPGAPPPGGAEGESPLA